MIEEIFVGPFFQFEAEVFAGQPVAVLGHREIEIGRARLRVGGGHRGVKIDGRMNFAVAHGFQQAVADIAPGIAGFIRSQGRNRQWIGVF